MKHHIFTSIDINADINTVWEILMDFPAYSLWNPFIKSISGTLSVGSKITVIITPEKDREVRFLSKVLKMEKNRELRWLGKILFKGLFDGEHTLRVEPLPGGGTKFIHEERFSGLLIGFFWKKVHISIERGFDSMNKALKERAEAV